MNNKNEFEDFEEETIVFTDDDGNELEFSEIAYFEYDGKNYSVLVLANAQEDSEEEEVVFCEVVEDEEGYENFTIVDNEELNDKLFEEFLKLQECGCGCGCDDEDDDYDDEDEDDEEEAGSCGGCSGCHGCD